MADHREASGRAQLLGEPTEAIASAGRLALQLDSPVLGPEASEALEALLFGVASVDHPQVRGACARGLQGLYWRVDDPFGGQNVGAAERVVVGLSSALDRERDARVRVALIEALARHCFARAEVVLPLLRRAASADPSVEAREAASAALSSLEED